MRPSQIKVRIPKPLRIAALGLALALPLMARPAMAQPIPPTNADWHEGTKKKLDEVRKTDAKAALAGARAWLAVHPNLVKDDAYTLSQVYEWMGWLHRVELHDFPGSQQVLDEGIALLGTSFERHLLIGQKAKFMVWDNQAKEAEAMLALNWPLAEAEDFRRIEFLAVPYVEILNRSGRSAQAAKMLRELQERYPARVAWFPFEWIPKLLVPALNKSGDAETALSWAKLIWMTCPFTEKSINDSTQMLLQSWTAADLTPAKGQAFLKAQDDAKLPNPLKSVPLPAFKPELVQRDLVSMKNPHEHITLQMIAGDWHSAMLEARSFLIERADDPKAPLEICRVFKAADLNIVRANAFLTFLKDGQGENPVAAFLKEHPKQDAVR